MVTWVELHCMSLLLLPKPRLMLSKQNKTKGVPSRENASLKSGCITKFLGGNIFAKYSVCWPLLLLRTRGPSPSLQRAKGLIANSRERKAVKLLVTYLNTTLSLLLGLQGHTRLLERLFHPSHGRNILSIQESSLFPMGKLWQELFLCHPYI